MVVFQQQTGIFIFIFALSAPFALQSTTPILSSFSNKKTKVESHKKLPSYMATCIQYTDKTILLH